MTETDLSIVGERLETELILENYTAFKELLAFRVAESQVDTPRARALHLIIARQVELLDGISEVIGIGRPGCAEILLRPMYENYLAILLIAFHPEKQWLTKFQSKKTMRDEKTRFLTRVDIIARFSAFADFNAFAEFERSKSDFDKSHLVSSLGSIGEYRKRYKTLRERANLAKSAYQMDKHNYWHPFKSTWGLYYYLWPRRGKPKFPRRIFVQPRKIWQDWYEQLFSKASHEVHSSPLSLSRNLDLSGTGPMIADAPKFEDPHQLSIANGLFVFSVAALAEAFDARRLYNQSFSHLSSLPTSVRPRKRITPSQHILEKITASIKEA